MALEIRGPNGHHRGHWTVFSDGRQIPGHITADGDRYRIVLEGMRRSPLPPFDSLQEAAQALVEYRADAAAQQP
jgi:hypothetical protein